MVLRSRVLGCGAYLPERVLTNAELARKVETSDEWIRQRTGIAQRYIAAEGELGLVMRPGNAVHDHAVVGRGHVLSGGDGCARHHADDRSMSFRSISEGLSSHSLRGRM